jgi:drug/metabolite transporter (DMT)-like permease
MEANPRWFTLKSRGLTPALHQPCSSEAKAISGSSKDQRRELEGWIFTSIGVLCFSFSFVTARLALGGFDPGLIALARAAGAGIIATGCILIGKYPLPTGKQIARICLAAVGIVFVFPILTTISLRTVPASHAATIGAILPILTALFGVVRKRERPPLQFWLIAAGATSVVAWFLLGRSHGWQLDRADLLIVIACIGCAYGYAEGGLVSQEIGGWRAICWALAFSMPVGTGLLIGYATLTAGIIHAPGGSAWFGLLYQVLVSQFLGFAFYYRGLALGGVAKMSQIQQLQAVLAVLAASLVLGEQIETRLWIVLALLLVAVAAARWSLSERSEVRGER